MAARLRELRALRENSSSVTRFSHCSAAAGIRVYTAEIELSRIRHGTNDVRAPNAPALFRPPLASCAAGTSLIIHERSSFTLSGRAGVEQQLATGSSSATWTSSDTTAALPVQQLNMVARSKTPTPLEPGQRLSLTILRENSESSRKFVLAQVQERSTY